MKFLAILKAFGAIVTFGKSLEILLEPCNCGNRDVKHQKDYGGYWFYFCPSCHIRSTGYSFKRSAKRAWNADMWKGGHKW